MKYMLVGQKENKMDSLAVYSSMDDMDKYTSSFKDVNELVEKYPEFKEFEIISVDDDGKQISNLSVYYHDTRNEYVKTLLNYILEEQKQAAKFYNMEHPTYQYTEYWLQNMSSLNFRTLVHMYDEKYHFSEQKSIEKNK